MSFVPPLPAAVRADPPRSQPSQPTKTKAIFHRIGSLSFSILLTVICLFFTILSFGQQIGTNPKLSPVMVLVVSGLLSMMAVSILLIWRYRWPMAITAIAATLPIVFPTTVLPALIAVSITLHQRRGRRVWALLGLVYIATIVSIVWDVFAGKNSFLGLFTGAEPDGAPLRPALFWLAPLLAAVLLAPSIAIGLVRRARVERDDARMQTRATEHSATALHTEVARERERQEVAREIHDTLASRLSALSLHAGALELSVPDGDSDAARAARVVRQSAQSSLDDLRHVIEVLRNPLGSPVSSQATTLSDIAVLVDEAHALKDRVRSQIVVSDPLGCDAEVAHAAYRIVQEAFSNARRHAPGAELLLDLRGGPGTGISIRMVNALPTKRAPVSSGGGHGVVGMSERAQLLGGSFSASETPDGSFTVEAWLPWVRQNGG